MQGYRKDSFGHTSPHVFSENTWVDTEAIVDIAKEFSEHVKETHNGLWVLLFRDNLVVHASNIIKAIFTASKAFLSYFPLALPNPHSL